MQLATEIAFESPGMAGVVAPGVGAQPTPGQADGGSLERASLYRKDVVEGRWVIETRHRGKPWEVIVEPDLRGRLLVMVTAYPLWK
jgi:hypothetical protein